MINYINIKNKNLFFHFRNLYIFKYINIKRFKMIKNKNTLTKLKRYNIQNKLFIKENFDYNFANYNYYYCNYFVVNPKEDYYSYYYLN